MLSMKTASLHITLVSSSIICSRSLNWKIFAKIRFRLHIVEKKIPYIDDTGTLIKPEEPNGYKFETLILDMIQMMDTCLPFEVERDKEFAPIKNKTGIDSVESAVLY